MCNCIAAIEDKIKAQRGTDKVFMMRQGRSEIAITPITISGIYSKHNRYISAKWLYCPFCGGKDDQESIQPGDSSSYQARHRSSET